jgi:hypothetical protein
MLKATFASFVLYTRLLSVLNTYQVHCVPGIILGARGTQIGTLF